MQPCHAGCEPSGSSAVRGNRQLPQHPACPLPADQPGAAFSRPDLPGKHHKARVMQ